jgi:hypothetical protein
MLLIRDNDKLRFRNISFASLSIIISYLPILHFLLFNGISIEREIGIHCNTKLPDMFKVFVQFCFLLFAGTFSYAQSPTVSGVITDKELNTAVQSATVMLQRATDTTNVRTAVSDSVGRFRFLEVTADSFNLVISAIGYGRIVKPFRIDTADLDIRVDVSRSAGVLAGVTVTASITPVSQKGDTIQYNASQYKVNPDATVEDLTRKMPGITIENGQVKANGENVQKVTLDGRELFGDDATAALRNLPAEIVDKIQVFDRLSDQAQFTGVDDGSSTKGINIITKANMRNGQFGRVFAGYGTDSRYQAGGNTTFLKENRKISIVGNFNNINQQNFATQDLLGVTSSAQRGGGSRGGGQRSSSGQRGGSGGGGYQGGGNFGSSANFLVGQQNGINRTNAAGINYSDNWGKKAIVTGSYFFNNTNNTTSELLNRQYFSEAINNLSQSNQGNSKNYNHRVNMRVELRLDSANQLIISPNISLQDNSSARDISTSFLRPNGTAASRTHNLNTSSRNGANINNNILYRHSFPKRGRTFSVNLSTGYNNRDGEVYTSQFDTTFTATGFRDTTARRFTDQSSNGLQLSTNFTYTEPLGKKGQLQVNYNPSYSKSKADQEAFQYDKTSDKYSVFSPSLSSRFDNTTSAQRGGVAYRFNTKDNQFSVGADYQQSTLKSNQEFPRVLMVNKSFTNVLPNAMVRFKTSTNSNLRIMYRANTNQPSVSQLQDVYDITNAPFITAGNPQLEQQYMHIVSGRYTYTNTKKGLLFVGNLFLQSANNYITNATFVPLNDSALTSDIVLRSGQQLTKPVNLDGYTSIRSFFTFAVPVKFIKSNLNMNAGVSFSKLPGIINNQTNVSDNTTYTLGSVIASNVSQYVDFTVSYSANFNNVNNGLKEALNQKYFSHVASVQLNLLSKTGWFFQNDLNNQLYSGLTEGFNQSYYLWNMAVGKKFLKNKQGELKLSVFDLLKQNRSIVRTVTENYIEDEQNQVLQQYFMLTFSYNLRNFGKPPQPPARTRTPRL